MENPKQNQKLEPGDLCFIVGTPEHAKANGKIVKLLYTLALGQAYTLVLDQYPHKVPVISCTHGQNWIVETCGGPLPVRFDERNGYTLIKRWECTAKEILIDRKYLRKIHPPEQEHDQETHVVHKQPALEPA